MTRANAVGRRTAWTRAVVRVAGALVVGAVGALGFVSSAHAVPVTYIETIRANPTNGSSPSGSLGGVHFGPSSINAVLTFTFIGDTDDVMTWFVQATHPAGGSEILKGRAFVRVSEARSGATLIEGQFADADRIFVSADNTNHGVGFGSSGLPPAPDFEKSIQVAYPFALIAPSSTPPITLMSGVDVSGVAMSCVNYPQPYQSSCGAPIRLRVSTLVGDIDLVVDASNGKQLGRFTARTGPPEYFMSLSRVSFRILGGAVFALTGNFALGPGSDGIDPIADGLTLQVGTAVLDVPPGSFRKDGSGGFMFEGNVGDVVLSARIAPLGNDSYSLLVNSNGADVQGATTLRLTIGNDTGTATIGGCPYDVCPGGN